MQEKSARSRKLGRPRLDPSATAAKKAISFPPNVLADIDFVASFSRSNRSAVIVALLSAPLHDLVSSIENSILATKNDPTGAVHVEGHTMEFLYLLHGTNDFQSLIVEDCVHSVPRWDLGGKHE